jgi:hypothetical protein
MILDLRSDKVTALALLLRSRLMELLQGAASDECSGCGRVVRALGRILRRVTSICIAVVHPDRVNIVPFLQLPNRKMSNQGSCVQ